MGLIDALFGSPLQQNIDRGLDFLYGGRPTAGPGGFAGPVPEAPPGFYEQVNNGGMLGGPRAPTVPGMPDVGIAETGALPQPQGSYEANDIVVEGFKPKKRSFLGFLADAYLMSKGGKPLFAERIQRKNVDKALRGYADNPLEAIRRLGQIHGMGPEAVKLHDQYSDNKRADETKSRLIDNDNDKRIKSISGLAGVALKNPRERQAAINQYNHRLATWGLLDQYGLPDDVSDAELEAIAYGVLPMDKQERINYQKQRIDQLERDTESKIEDRATDNAQAATNERGRNARNATNEAGRQSRSKTGAETKDFAHRAPNGSLVETFKGGTNIKVTNPNGSVIFFKRGADGKPVMIKRMTAEEYAAATKEK